MIIILVAFISSFIVLVVVYSRKAITVVITFFALSPECRSGGHRDGNHLPRALKALRSKRKKRKGFHLIGENILTRLQRL